MSHSNNYKTSFLFPRTSFLIGIGSIINIAGNYFDFNYYESDDEADFRAIENDWGVIGQDIAHTIQSTPVDKLRLA